MINFVLFLKIFNFVTKLSQYSFCTRFVFSSVFLGPKFAISSFGTMIGTQVQKNTYSESLAN